MPAARPYYEQALAIHRKVLGEEHPDTAASLNNLGYLAAGRWATMPAPGHTTKQALAIRRKVLGEEHPDTATSLNNLGSLLQEMGDYAGARPYFEQALAISRKVLGEEHPDTATSLNNLGFLLQEHGRLCRRPPVLRAGPGDPPESAGQTAPIYRHQPQQSGLFAAYNG